MSLGLYEFDTILDQFSDTNMNTLRRFRRISTLVGLFRYRRKSAVEDLAVKPVTQFPVEIDNEVRKCYL